MFSSIRKRLTFANVAMTLALVFAMSGGAYAAKKYLITSIKQIKPSVVAQLKGKDGKDGAQGPAGAQGPVGPAGKDGAQGKEGLNGTDGKDGKAGATGPAGPTGPTGPKGLTGPEGQSGFTETLPPGKTETGEWSLVRNVPGSGERVAAANSFNIPLASVPTAHYLRKTGKEPFYNGETEKEEERTVAGCSGTVVSPTAAAGNLCIYTSEEASAFKNVFGNIILPVVCPLSSGGACVGSTTGADKYGFGLETISESELGPGLVSVAGTWAVTAS